MGSNPSPHALQATALTTRPKLNHYKSPSRDDLTLIQVRNYFNPFRSKNSIWGKSLKSSSEEKISRFFLTAPEILWDGVFPGMRRNLLFPRSGQTFGGTSWSRNLRLSKDTPLFSKRSWVLIFPVQGIVSFLSFSEKWHWTSPLKRFNN